MPVFGLNSCTYGPAFGPVSLGLNPCNEVRPGCILQVSVSIGISLAAGKNAQGLCICLGFFGFAGLILNVLFLISMVLSQYSLPRQPVIVFSQATQLVEGPHRPAIANRQRWS